MAAKSQRSRGQDGALSSLNLAIDALNLAKEASSITPAKTAFSSTSVLLATIRDLTINNVDYVKLGLSCADVCKALDQGMNGGRVNQPTQFILRAIDQLTITVVEIQTNIIKRGKRNPISRYFREKDDNKAIATWRLDLNRVLQVFNTEFERNTCADIRHDVANTHATVSGIHRDPPNANNITPDAHLDVSNTHAVVSDIYHDTLKNREDTNSQNLGSHASAPGESPPPPRRNTRGTASDVHRDVMKAGAIISEVQRDVANTQAMVRDMLKGQQEAGGRDRSGQNGVSGEPAPPPPRTFFGRDELIEEIVDFVEGLTPFALVGAGGIGKTSLALTVLHDDRIKRRFGDERRFIRCDKFPASLPHFLRRLSKAIGAGVDNPEDLTPLRSFLSSKDMFIVLDNAESVLDPHVPSGEEIYGAVEELSQLSNICLCITSRISIIPPDCRRLEIPTLSMEAACDTFYRIYQHGERSGLINSILEQLGFHPLSITLLATVAHHNKWDANRLAREWGEQHTDMLQTDHKKSLAAAIKLSLSSLMFQELGPDARELLEVIALFPQGVDENNIDWLFPTIAGRKKIFDKLCVLSLTYRSDGFITMLAPIRDHLSPKDPALAPLLCSTKDRYFSRLAVDVRPGQPGFEGARWIRSEDANVEHLLDIFTTVDSTSDAVWHTCVNFMKHLTLQKPRLVVLGPKIEALTDDHPLKLECLLQLSQLLGRVGNQAEPKRLLTHLLKLSREQGDDDKLARSLYYLSAAHVSAGQLEEGIQEIKEASEVYERLGETTNQALCLATLASFLDLAGQFDAAEEAASRAVGILPEDEQYLVCHCHQILGDIYQSKGEIGKAIHHFEVALGTTSSSNHPTLGCAVHLSLARLFADQGRFDDAQTHVEHAKLQAANDNDTYFLAAAMMVQAGFWYKQRRFEEAKSEALGALDLFEKLGAASFLEGLREFLLEIDHHSRASVTPRELDEDDNDRAAKSE